VKSKNIASNTLLIPLIDMKIPSILNYSEITEILKRLSHLSANTGEDNFIGSVAQSLKQDP
jgi:hypothetical protein